MYPNIHSPAQMLNRMTVSYFKVTTYNELIESFLLKLLLLLIDACDDYILICSCPLCTKTLLHTRPFIQHVQSFRMFRFRFIPEEN